MKLRIIAFLAQKMSPVAIKVFYNEPFEFQEDWETSFILNFKWLVSAHLKSYRPHLLTQASYGPKLHFAKFSAESPGS